MKFLIVIAALAAAYYSGFIEVGPYHLQTNTELRGGTITGTIKNASFRRIRCIRTEVALLDKNNRVYQTLTNTTRRGLWPGSRTSFRLSASRASRIRGRSQPC